MTESGGLESVQQPGSASRYTRRLIDHVLAAFHYACDQGNFEVSASLLEIAEFMMRRPSLSPDGRERRDKYSLVAAYERLWHMQHPEIDDAALAAVMFERDRGELGNGSTKPDSSARPDQTVTGGRNDKGSMVDRRATSADR
jgi:hypothetical protein